MRWSLIVLSVLLAGCPSGDEGGGDGSPYADSQPGGPVAPAPGGAALEATVGAGPDDERRLMASMR